MLPTTCGAEEEANDLFLALTTGVDFTLPDVDLTDPEFQIPATDLDAPVTLTNADLTTKVIDGTGTFDVIMSSMLAHLKGEFDKGRITGAEYTKAYVNLVQASLTNAVQFLLGRDTAYWQAVAAQQAAKIAEAGVVKARVDLEIAKAQLAATRYQAANQQAEYALTKMKLSTESINYCVANFQLTDILPYQKILVQEQGEVARAQTLNTRSDGVTTVVGVLGKQKDLYTQQIESYKRDAEIKAAKLFTDAWITQKTIDEGLLPPTAFANTSLDAILADIKTANNIG
jgi:hypothetical protein